MMTKDASRTILRQSQSYVERKIRGRIQIRNLNLRRVQILVAEYSAQGLGRHLRRIAIRIPSQNPSIFMGYEKKINAHPNLRDQP